MEKLLRAAPVGFYATRSALTLIPPFVGKLLGKGKYSGEKN